jgi:hypothetical protein
MKWCDPLPIMLGVLASLPYQGSPGGSVVFCDKFLYYGNATKEGTLQLV